jgi:hypothetical protein
MLKKLIMDQCQKQNNNPTQPINNAANITGITLMKVFYCFRIWVLNKWKYQWFPESSKAKHLKENSLGN